MQTACPGDCTWEQAVFFLSILSWDGGRTFLVFLMSDRYDRCCSYHAVFYEGQKKKSVPWGGCRLVFFDRFYPVGESNGDIPV